MANWQIGYAKRSICSIETRSSAEIAVSINGEFHYTISLIQ